MKKHNHINDTNLFILYTVYRLLLKEQDKLVAKVEVH